MDSVCSCYCCCWYLHKWNVKTKCKLTKCTKENRAKIAQNEWNSKTLEKERQQNMLSLFAVLLCVGVYLCVCVSFFYLIRLIQSFVVAATRWSPCPVYNILVSVACPVPTGHLDRRHRRHLRLCHHLHHHHVMIIIIVIIISTIIVSIVVCGSCGKLKLVVYFAQHKQISTMLMTRTTRTTRTPTRNSMIGMCLLPSMKVASVYRSITRNSLLVTKMQIELTQRFAPSIWIHSLTHSIIHSLTYWLTHSLTHSLEFENCCVIFSIWSIWKSHS